MICLFVSPLSLFISSFNVAFHKDLALQSILLQNFTIHNEATPYYKKDDIINTPDWLDLKTVQLDGSRNEEKLRNSLDESLIDEHNPPFKKHEGGVIVTKVLWSENTSTLKRMLCTITAAYNRFVNYDIVIFTTLPWDDNTVEELAKIVAPAKLIVSTEGPPLEQHLASMTNEEITFLEERCNVNKTAGKNLTWFNYCTEKDIKGTNNLGYAWQAEFRAYHLWTHPLMMNYKYMIWVDSDAICSHTWLNDPIDAMVKNNLTLMFERFYGNTYSEKFTEKMMKTYGEPLCYNEIQDGHLKPLRGKECETFGVMVKQVGGFFHITNLEIYRQPKHQRFLRELVGDYKFSRQWDDQLAVAVVPSMEDPTRAWHLRSKNFTLNILHHRKYDAYEKIDARNVKTWWTQDIRDQWHAGRVLCDFCF